MDDLITLVLATGNAGKTAEIRDLLTGFPVTIKNLDDFGPTPPVVEDGDSFDENAYKKSSFVSRVLGLPALADDANRQAAFECVLSLAVPTGAALTYEARCEGLIAEKPAGENGFGYDPVFYYPPLKKTFAQLSREEKSRVSHRGLALRELGEEFDKVLTWIRQHMPVREKIICQEDQ